MKAEFTAIIDSAPEGGYWAVCPEISGANGQGETVEEAKDSLREAIELILEDRREDNLRGTATWILVDEQKSEALDEHVRWEESAVCPRESSSGVLLAGARYRENLSQLALAEMTGIPQRHISEMENGKRPIGKTNAEKLAETLNVDYRIFL